MFNHVEPFLASKDRCACTPRCIPICTNTIAALVRVARSVEKEDWPEAAHRLYTDVPQKMVRVDGSDT